MKGRVRVHIDSEVLSIILGIGYATQVFIYPYLIPADTVFSRIVYLILIFAPSVIIPLLILFPSLLKKSDYFKAFLMYYSLASVSSSAYFVVQIYLQGVTQGYYIVSTIRGVFIFGVFTAAERLIDYLEYWSNRNKVSRAL